MELASNLSEQIAFNTRPKNEEHMLIVIDTSAHEEHFSQPLQTNNKQFKLAVTFLTGYNGIFNVTDKDIKFFFAKSISDDFIQFTKPTGAYKIESLNNENKRIIIDGKDYTEANYPFTIKQNSSTLGIIIEISKQKPLVRFIPNDCIRNLLGFNPTTPCEYYNQSPNPVDTPSFDNIFPGCNITQGMIFKGRRSRIIHNFTMDVDPVYKQIENFRGGVQRYMMESKNVVSSICLKLKNENNQLISFNGHLIPSVETQLISNEATQNNYKMSYDQYYTKRRLISDMIVQVDIASAQQVKNPKHLIRAHQTKDSINAPDKNI